MFEEFKALADKKKELFDGDIEALVLRAEGSASGPWTLAGLKTVADSAKPAAEATISIENGKLLADSIATPIFSRDKPEPGED